jgi:SM-20-related protein
MAKSDPTKHKLIQTQSIFISMPEFSKKAYAVTQLLIGREQRKIYIIDGVFDKKLKSSIHNYTLNLNYELFPAIETDAVSIRHLAHNFKKKEQKENFLSYLISFAEEFFSKNGMLSKGVNRMYANMHLFGDYQLIHNDGDEWTALFFTNQEWQEDWGGELIFYGDRKSDPAIAIPPAEGRAVIFDGLIPHRGGVPSKLCLEPRMNIVIKFKR